MDYNEWGEITYREALSITSSYRRIYPQSNYTGHDWDDVLGMYYAKARFYSAEDKRFVAMDPVKGSIAQPLSLVPYVYCVDNPLRWVDPLGLSRVNTNSELADTGHSQQLTKASAFPVGTIMEVSRDGAKLRQYANVNSPVVCHLNKGYLVTILGKTMSGNGYTWEHVNFKGKVGWVMGDQLRLGYDVVPSGPSVVPSTPSSQPSVPGNSDPVQTGPNSGFSTPDTLIVEKPEPEKPEPEKPEPEGPALWGTITNSLQSVGRGIAIGVTAAGCAIIIVADWVTGSAATISGWIATLEHTIQDKALDPFGAVSAIENATKDIPGLRNVSAHIIDDYQGFIHFATDRNVEFYDGASDFLNRAHDFTGGVKEWLGDTYHDVVGCPGVSQPAIPTVNLNSLPAYVQTIYQKYSQAGWKGNIPNQTPGTKAGGIYQNSPKQGDQLLPETTIGGQQITYREFDVNNRIQGQARDTERFIVSSDGRVYYTNDHYHTFIEIIQ